MGIRDRIRSALTPSAPPLTPPPLRVDATPVPGLGHEVRRYADSIVNALTGLGGDNDKGRAGRPNTAHQFLTLSELEVLYRTNHYARRFIDKVVEDGTRAGWKVKGGDGASDEDLLADESKALNVQAQFCEAARWARLYGGAVVYMVLEEDIPARFRRPGMARYWLREPLNPAKVKGVVNLVVLDRFEATAHDWVTDTRDPEYGQPNSWVLSPSQQVEGLEAGAIVHRSRVLYFPGAQLPPRYKKGGDGHDDSVIEAAYQAIAGKTSVDQAGNVLAHEVKVDVMRVASKSSMSLTDEQEATLLNTKMKLIAKSKSLLNMVLLGPGDEFETRSTTITGWGELDDRKKQELAAAFGWPQTVIFGEPPGGLNTDGQSHKDLWLSLVAAWQVTHLQPQLEKLYDVVWAAEGDPGVEEWTIEFLPIETPTDAERAAVRKTVAETDAIYLDRGVLAPEGVAKGRHGERGWQLDLPAQPVPEVDDTELDPAAIEEAMRENEVVEEEEEEVREDAADSCWIGLGLGPALSAQVEQLRARASQLLGQDLDTQGHAPHVTLLYLGAAPDPGQVLELAGDVLAGVRPVELGAQSVGVFPSSPQSDGLVPVVVLLEHWSLGEARGKLLEALAHQVASPQHRGYRPHITLGYFRGELEAEQVLALGELEVHGVRGLASIAQVNAGGQATWVPLGSRVDTDEGGEE